MRLQKGKKIEKCQTKSDQIKINKKLNYHVKKTKLKCKKKENRKIKNSR